MMSLTCRGAAAQDALKQVQLSHQDAICFFVVVVFLQFF